MAVCFRPYVPLGVTPHIRRDSGAAVAKYAGQNVHHRLVRDEAYKQHDYRLALKNAFLGTDEDIRSSEPSQTSCDV